MRMRLTENEPPVRLMSLARACAELNIATVTGERMAARGEFPRVVRIGNKRMILEAHFLAYKAKLARQLCGDDVAA